MNEKERALKDIRKLEAVIKRFAGLGLGGKYPESYEWAKNYLHDAKHYYEKEDYFSSFGCANYAYGIIDGIMIHEGRKEEEV